MDPVTRIEGHMKVEVTVDTVNGVTQVVDAKCTGTLFRGFETILRGRDPRDAPAITERICGVCPVSHGMAAVLALEAAAGKTAPANGRIIRNLVLGANYLQSHILHFYLLAALDFVNAPNSAPWTPAWNPTDTVNGQALDFRSDPTLDAVSGHIVKAVEMRRAAHQMGAIFGGKLPMPGNYVAGGSTSVPTAARVSAFRSHLSTLSNFISSIYIPDVEAVANIYSDYKQIGEGSGNLLSYGVFDLDNAGSQKLLARGISNGGTLQALNIGQIREHVAYSWYSGSTSRPPATGVTTPVDPNTKTNAYSWLKAPRYTNAPYEAGPLARMVISKKYSGGISVIDRHLARAYEAKIVADAMNGWLSQLEQNLSGPVYTPYTNPSSGTGVGLTEAPRGALGHWVSISSQKVANYQVITPTCWNASPQDANRVKGPMEQALIGTPITDPERPVEALRVIHSFDPCLSCAVHVMRPKGKPIVIQTGSCQ
ncbi:MAG: nickel-dependent hydrogenase large subunit [Syntrophobacteraceae bacterium]